MSAGRDAVAALEAQAQRWETPCGAGSLVWRSWGRGAPVLALHGASGSWRHWFRNIPFLARHYRLIAADMPGFGASALPPQPLTPQSLADALVAGLDAVVGPATPVPILGFSFGGIVGGLMAERLGARIPLLFLSGTGGMGIAAPPMPALHRIPPDASPADVRRIHRENLGILMFADPAQVDETAVSIQVENLREARYKIGDVYRSDMLLRVLPGLQARLCAIWGGRDVFVAGDPDAPRRVLAAHQPAIDYRVLPTAGHWAIYEAADTVNPLLLEMLAAHGE
jgi:pimeloyl-ACP methyl ester carboxylesterase